MASGQMEQGTRNQEELERLERRWQDEHLRYLTERDARERAERQASELSQLIEIERERAEQAERRAGAIINQWLHPARPPRKRWRRSRR